MFVIFHQGQVTGRKITDKELKNVRIERSDFHGEWNYKIKPRVDIV
jgi:hypothetical protein